MSKETYWIVTIQSPNGGLPQQGSTQQQGAEKVTMECVEQ